MLCSLQRSLLFVRGMTMPVVHVQASREACQTIECHVSIRFHVILCGRLGSRNDLSSVIFSIFSMFFSLFHVFNFFHVFHFFFAIFLNHIEPFLTISKNFNIFYNLTFFHFFHFFVFFMFFLPRASLAPPPPGLPQNIAFFTAKILILRHESG